MRRAFLFELANSHDMLYNASSADNILVMVIRDWVFCLETTSLIHLSLRIFEMSSDLLLFTSQPGFFLTKKNNYYELFWV